MYQVTQRPYWKKEFETYEKIGLIRHPFDWLKSFYKICLEAGSHWNDWVPGAKNPGKEHSQKTLNLFLANTMTQFDWLTHPETGKLLVDKIYRIEDLAKISAKWGVDNPERLNETGAPIPIEWTDDQLGLIKKRFARELSYYDAG